MHAQTIVLPVLLMAAFAGFAIWTVMKRNAGLANLGPAMQDFFQRTGYRYADMAPEPITRHVERAVSDAKNVGTETRYVRSFQGQSVRFEQGGQVTNTGYAVFARWVAPLQQSPLVVFHLADRSLSSLGKGLREAMTNTRQDWQPRYPHAVAIGIRELDERFVVHAADPAAAASFLRQNAGVLAGLFQTAEVDLWVDGAEIVFSDPAQRNITAALGGGATAVALANDPVQRMALSLPVHDRIAELLANLARAVRPTNRF